MGHLFVGEDPLDESPMKDHPLTPMRDSSLVRLLRPQVEGKVGLVNRHIVEAGEEAIAGRLTELAEEHTGHVVVDAVSARDLEKIAMTARTHPLLTGGSAVAQTLPTVLKSIGLDIPMSENPMLPKTNGGSIVVSGSCSAMTRKQVAHYTTAAASLKIDPLSVARDGAVPASEWLNNQDPQQPVMVYATAEPDEVAEAQRKLGVEQAGQLIEQTLASVAKMALGLGRTRIVVAGGETSGAVTQALNIRRMIVGKEIAPGVPWTSCESDGTSVALALKSGNFGVETFFEDAISMLEPE